jgi:hypothetical protein
MTSRRSRRNPQRSNGPLMARRLAEWPASEWTPNGAPPLTCCFTLERVTGIEPALSAWEADVLPLNYTRGHVQRLAGPAEEPSCAVFAQTSYRNR